MQRVPEAEVMSDEDEVSAYASAASQKHLDAIDDTFVDQVLSLGSPEGLLAGRLIDIGCGPGNITLKIAQRCPRLTLVGVDRSANMVREAQRAAAGLGFDKRVSFLQSNAGQIPFSDCAFDVVLSNSVLHHLTDPLGALEEMLRVSRPAGAILLRDLRRPSRLVFPWHVKWHGRHYTGTMKKLFEDSVRAAYTPDELADLLNHSGISDGHIFLHERTHMGFVYRGQNR